MCLRFYFVSYYLLFIASTGLRFAASQAGTIPAIIPIKEATETPLMMFASDNDKLMPFVVGIRRIIPLTRSIPIMPPAIDKATASTKN